MLIECTITGDFNWNVTGHRAFVPTVSTCYHFREVSRENSHVDDRYDVIRSAIPIVVIISRLQIFDAFFVLRRNGPTTLFRIESRKPFIDGIARKLTL